MKYRIDENGNEKELVGKVYIDGSGQEHEVVAKVYIDGNGQEHEIWSNGQIFDLGTNTTFNIKQLFPNLYNKLTVDNFYVVSSTKMGGTTDRMYNDDQTASINLNQVKSYDATTGILTCYYAWAWQSWSGGSHWEYSNNACRVLLVKKPTKLIPLGSGQTFDIKDYVDDYSNLTDLNFVLLSQPTVSGSARGGSGGNYGTCGVNKSYNSTTGILTFRNYSGSERGSTSYSNVSPYIALKIK